jgi:hypothetical protein
VSAVAAALPLSVLREALLEGAGSDLTVRAVVGLCERAGLLARTDVVEAFVELGPDADPVLWADLDMPALVACIWGDGVGLELTTVERLVLQLVVQLVDLGAVLQRLDGQPRMWATAAVLATVGHGGPGCRAGLVLTSDAMSIAPAVDLQGEVVVGRVAGEQDPDAQGLDERDPELDLFRHGYLMAGTRRGAR